MTLIHIFTDVEIAHRLIDEDRRTWIDVIEVRAMPVFKVPKGGRVFSYEDVSAGVRAIDLPNSATALFYPSQPSTSKTTALRFTFDSESAAMAFRLTHTDHVLDRDLPNAARSVLMALELA